MAGQAHVDILQRGVDGWNLWREQIRGVEPDLYRISLRKVDLAAANLDNADPRRPTSRGRNLSGRTSWTRTSPTRTLVGPFWTTPISQDRRSPIVTSTGSLLGTPSSRRRLSSRILFSLTASSSYHCRQSRACSVHLPGRT